MVVMPDGKVSVKVPPVRDVGFGFVMVTVIVVVPPTGIVAGENDLVTVGKPKTSKLLLAGDPAPGVWVLVAPDVVLI